MHLRKLMKKCLTTTVIAAFLLQATACGTLMYPERKGQVGGKIDPGIAILDGIGLLFFIIPGVIAFAVDFSNGTIYLPSGKKSLLQDDSKSVTAIHVDQDKMNIEEIESVVLAKTGVEIDLEDDEVQVVTLHDISELKPAYADAVTR